MSGVTTGVQITLHVKEKVQVQYSAFLNQCSILHFFQSGCKPAQPPALPGPKADQAVLPGMEAPPAQPIPSGSDIRAAREADGVNLRDFTKTIGGPSFSTWAAYERGEAIRVGSIKPDAWQRVRDFIAQHAPKADPDGGKGTA